MESTGPIVIESSEEEIVSEIHKSAPEYASDLNSIEEITDSGPDIMVSSTKQQSGREDGFIPFRSSDEEKDDNHNFTGNSYNVFNENDQSSYSYGLKSQVPRRWGQQAHVSKFSYGKNCLLPSPSQSDYTYDSEPELSHVGSKSFVADNGYVKKKGGGQLSDGDLDQMLQPPLHRAARSNRPFISSAALGYSMPHIHTTPLTYDLSELRPNGAAETSSRVEWKNGKRKFHDSMKVHRRANRVARSEERSSCKSSSPTRPISFFYPPNPKDVMDRGWFVELVEVGIPFRAAGQHSQLNEAVQNVTTVCMIDCDNAIGVLRNETHSIPEDIFIWGFLGGDMKGGIPNLMPFMTAISTRRMAITLCGGGSNAADFAMTYYVAELHRVAPKTVRVVIISNDNDLRRAAIYISDRMVTFIVPGSSILSEIISHLPADEATLEVSTVVDE